MWGIFKLSGIKVKELKLFPVELRCSDSEIIIIAYFYWVIPRIRGGEGTCLTTLLADGQAAFQGNMMIPLIIKVT